MKYQTLPGTDLSVSQLCFGCWGVTSDNMQWGNREEADSIAAMQAAVDGGVNFFDTAAMYGDGASEELVAKFLKETGKRDDLVIASKIRPHMMAPDDVIAECEGSLQRLNVDCIDLYQTHWSSREIPLADTWGTMQELQRQGKVRHIGVSNMGIGDLADTVAIQKPVTNQIPYNLLWRVIEAEIQPMCVAEEIGILIYSPLQHGILCGKYHTADDVPEGRARSKHFSTDRPFARHGEAGHEDETFEAIASIRQVADDAGRTMASTALRWLLHRDGVTSVIAGARNAEQSKQNIECVEEPLSDESIARLDEGTDKLRKIFGTNPDMWSDRYR